MLNLSLIMGLYFIIICRGLLFLKIDEESNEEIEISNLHDLYRK